MERDLSTTTREKEGSISVLSSKKYGGMGRYTGRTLGPGLILSWGGGETDLAKVEKERSLGEDVGERGGRAITGKSTPLNPRSLPFGSKLNCLEERRS